MVAWLFSLIKPMKDIHELDFLPTIEQLRDDLKYNSDTALVERLLRYRLFGTAPKVFIRNFNEEFPDVFIGRDDDVKYELIIGRDNSYPVSIIREGQSTPRNLDFEVVVVNSEKPLSDDIKFKMIAYINKYKLGRRFRIIYQNNELIYQTDAI